MNQILVVNYNGLIFRSPIISEEVWVYFMMLGAEMERQIPAIEEHITYLTLFGHAEMKIE